jgi:D-alanyl-D-alanine carboxypeptidase
LDIGGPEKSCVPVAEKLATFSGKEQRPVTMPAAIPPSARAFLGTIAFLTLTSGGLAQHERAASVLEGLDRLVALNEGHGGGVVRIAGPEGSLCVGAAGLTAGPGSAPMTPDTPFEIASITKAVTATVVLQLVEEGKFTLDSKLGGVLSGRHSRGFNPNITIRQLLSHTSGLGHYWEDGPKDRDGNNAFLRVFLASPERFWQPEDILDQARAIPARRPGSAFHYSDTNYVLLGLIIEQTTGRPLHEVFRTQIFDPLGMKSTWLSYRQKQRGTAPSHRYEGAEDLNDVPRQSADWAGGGLVSTARDLERFLRGLASGALFKNAATLPVMLGAVPVGEEDISYGLGLYRVKLDGALGEVWGHDGHGNSFAYYWPQRDITFTGTLNQTENDWWPLVEIFTGGGDPAVVVEQNNASFGASLSAGWDSLYMDRGVNGLRDKGYGAGIAWTTLEVTWGITDSDFLSVIAWQCFATQSPDYREFDATIDYTRVIGNWSLSAGYTFNYGYSEGNFFSNELYASAAFDWRLGPVTFTPSTTYFFTIGPDADDGQGFVQAGSSYLLFRLDASLPVYKDIVALEPWTAFGVNFDYNTKDIGDGETEPFTGANNLECGLAVPVRINRTITLSAFGAYSYAIPNLSSTARNTFWGGGSITFSF